MALNNKTILLVGSSRKLLENKFDTKDILFDYKCRFGFRWMAKCDELEKYMGNFDTIISSHYDHENVILNFEKYNIDKFTNTIMLVCPRASERYSIKKKDNIEYFDITNDEYIKLASIFKKYEFTKYTPRTGLVAMIWLSLIKKCKVYITGFDIHATDNTNNQDIAVENKKICPRHNARAESVLIKKLISEKIINVY